MRYRVLIGMEVHLQLRTKSKMFCRCPVRFGAPPNTLVCPVCLGLPGALPVPNRDAMILALSLAAALGSEIAAETSFDRKNYFYPDLPKGYQITQYDRPLATGGAVEIRTEKGLKKIRVRRLHVEEDVGKSVHGDDGLSRIDYNRAGTPLVEIVSEPDLGSPEEARDYLNALRGIAQYLDVSDVALEEGNLRCEPNVNLHVFVDERRIRTPIAEIKNLNSVRHVERALRREIERQLADYNVRGVEVEKGEATTRGYDETRDDTYALRPKDRVPDYRYFPEPDIPPITIGAAWRKESLARVPELPAVRRGRFTRELGLSEVDAEALCRDRGTADYFERVLQAGCRAKPAANWILGDLARLANERGAGIAGLDLPPSRLAELVALVDAGELTRQAAAREVLPRLVDSGEGPRAVVEALGLQQVDDEALLDPAARAAVARHPQAAADYRAGKKQALGALMGEVMRQTGGKANPKVVEAVLVRILEET